VKRVDYYAISQPWKMPKWLGATIGGVFAVIAIGSAVLIVQLTRTPDRPAPPMAAAAAAQGTSVQAAATVASTEPAAEPAAEALKLAKHERHHAKRHDKHAKATRVARRGGMTEAKSSAILAKHETKAAKRDRDALDKLLGM
jgi:hypothetical protein